MKQYTVSFTMHLDDVDLCGNHIEYSDTVLSRLVMNAFVGTLTYNEYIEDLVITEIQ